jgi:GAF domain-containing protein
MKRRSRESGKQAKPRRRKAEMPKPRNAPTVRVRLSPAAGQETNAVQLARERDEALEQLSAAAEVLRVISSSAGDLKPVFDIILENATRICAAKFGLLWIREGEEFRCVASHSVPAAYAAALERAQAIRFGPETAVGRVARTKRVVHIGDLTAEQIYADRDPQRVATVELGGARTLVVVPMLKERDLVGAIAIFRQEVRPFTEKQIELVQSFANQAVIAIENARLLGDLNKLNQQLEQRVTDQVGEIERMSRLRRFLPPQVADLIVASGTEKQLESHR